MKADRESKALEAPKQRIVIRPRAVNEKEFAVVVTGGSFGNLYTVVGAKPIRWVQQTDFNNDEAVGFLADRLAKLGVEDELFKVGAVPGATVSIDGREFGWEPTLSSAAELITSPRGTDARLDDNQRDTNRKRRLSYLERMDAKAAARAELEAERAAGIWTDDEGFAIENARPMTSRRAEIPRAKRIVVKVGSSSVSGPNVGQIGMLVDALASAHARGSEVILVSSAPSPRASRTSARRATHGPRDAAGRGRRRTERAHLPLPGSRSTATGSSRGRSCSPRAT